MTEALTFHHLISTQECMLSVSCKINIFESFRNSSSTQKSKLNECTSSIECDKSPSKVSNNLKKLFFNSKSEIK